MRDGAVGQLQGARFKVEQNGFQHCAEITIGRPIDLLDTVDVAVGGVRSDKTLDEPTGDVDGSVGVAWGALGDIARFRIGPRVGIPRQRVVSLRHFQGCRIVIKQVVGVACGSGQSWVGQHDVVLAMLVGEQSFGDTRHWKPCIRIFVREKIVIHYGVDASHELHRLNPRRGEEKMPIVPTEPLAIGRTTIHKNIAAHTLSRLVIPGQGSAVPLRHPRNGAAGTMRPTRHHSRQLGDIPLVIGRHGQSRTIQHEAAVGMTQNKTDGKELHDFARIVFIRTNDETSTCVIGSPIGDVGQINTHHRTVSDLLQQLAVFAKSTRSQHVPIIRAAVVTV